MQPNLLASCSIHFEDLLNLQCHVYWKDKDGVYKGYNNAFKSFGYNSPNDVIGKKDSDIFSPQIASTYIKNDAQIFLTKSSMIFREPGILKGNFNIIFLSHKMPLYDANHNINGLLGLSFIQDNIPQILQIKCLSCPQFSDICLSCNKRDTIHCPLPSDKEKECLEYLCQGLTLKMIAKKLNISPKTVETYIERAKVKFGCHNKAQLILAYLRLTRC